MVKIALFMVFICVMGTIFSCNHADYLLQREEALDPKATDSDFSVVVHDDEIVKESSFPKIYLFVYVNSNLVIKDYKSLDESNFYNGKFFGSFDRSIRLLHGKHLVRVKYLTYREGKEDVKIFEKELTFSTGKRIKIVFNKEYTIINE